MRLIPYLFHQHPASSNEYQVNMSRMSLKSGFNFITAERKFKRKAKLIFLGASRKFPIKPLAFLVYPACPVAPADGTGVGPEDRTGASLPAQ